MSPFAWPADCGAICCAGVAGAVMSSVIVDKKLVAATVEAENEGRRWNWKHWRYIIIKWGYINEKKDNYKIHKIILV